MSGQLHRSVAVIGLGNWGNSLAASLDAAGLLAARLHASPTAPPWTPAQTRQLDAPILWLAVPDGAIADTAARLVLARPNLRGQIVVHSSGALDRSVLVAAAQAGAQTGSVHPMMSFPTRRRVPLAGVRFAIEAEATAMERRLSRMVRRLGGVPAPLVSASKGLYHAGAMFGSPLLVATLSAGVRALCAAGRTEREALDLILPMAAATVENVRRRGLAASFSGPIARGDAATLKVHRHALQKHPLLAHVYDALACAAVQQLPCAELPCADRSAIKTALGTAADHPEIVLESKTRHPGTRRKPVDRRP